MKSDENFIETLIKVLAEEDLALQIISSDLSGPHRGSSPHRQDPDIP